MTKQKRIYTRDLLVLIQENPQEWINRRMILIYQGGTKWDVTLTVNSENELVVQFNGTGRVELLQLVGDWVQFEEIIKISDTSETIKIPTVKTVTEDKVE